MRIGHGYDVHRFATGRKLVIGGVTIEYDRGLLGHSDADVLTHAVMDALLGAAGLPDIGSIFPDTDPRFEGADSIGLLAEVGRMIELHHFRVDYIDCTIIAQAPKMKPHISHMRDNISRALGLDATRVNVKATTEEGLGFTGRREGIAAHSVCLLSEQISLIS